MDTKLRLRPDKYKDGINDLDRSFGRESRSLKAAYELLKVCALAVLRSCRSSISLQVLIALACGRTQCGHPQGEAAASRWAEIFTKLSKTPSPAHSSQPASTPLCHRTAETAPTRPSCRPPTLSSTACIPPLLPQGGWNSSNMVFMEGGFQQWR